MDYIFSFSVFIAIFAMLFEYLVVLFILAFVLRLIVMPLRYVYNKFFGWLNYI